MMARMMSSGRSWTGLLTSTLILAGCPDRPAGFEPSTEGSTTKVATGEPTGGEPTGGSTESGETTGAMTTGEPDTGGPADDDPSVFFVPARLGDEAFVLRVSPTTGIVEPFGPALPIAAGDIFSPSVVPTPDRKLVTVDCGSLQAPEGRFLVGDGSAWETLVTQDEFYLGGFRLAADASQYWYYETVATEPSPTSRAMVITLTGELVFMGEPRAVPAFTSPTHLGADAGWLLYYDTTHGKVLRPRMGEETLFPQSTVMVGAFATSLIIDAGPELAWLDLTGQPIAVPGFVKAKDSASGSYQIAGGTLSLLTDRKAEVVQKVPAEMRARDVLGHVGGAFVFGRPAPDAPYSTIDGDGGVVSQFEYEPFPDLPPGTIETSVTVRGSCLACATRTVVFNVHNSLIYDDWDKSVGTSIQLWRLDAAGAATGQSVLRAWVDPAELSNWPPYHFHFSVDGARLVWSEAAQLRQLDVAGNEESVIDTPYELLDLL